MTRYYIRTREPELIEYATGRDKQFIYFTESILGLTMEEISNLNHSAGLEMTSEQRVYFSLVLGDILKLVKIC